MSGEQREPKIPTPEESFDAGIKASLKALKATFKEIPKEAYSQRELLDILDKMLQSLAVTEHSSAPRSTGPAAPQPKSQGSM